MKGDSQVLGYLNKILANELTAINQYFLHARIYENWGLESLNKLEYKESIHAMKRADKLIKRILFLQGLPNLQMLNKLLIGENVQEMLRCDLEMEQECIELLREAIAFFEKCSDFVSRDLLIEILGEEEEHFDWLEVQLSLIPEMGIELYQQSMIGTQNHT